MKITTIRALALVALGFLLTVAWSQRDTVEQTQQELASAATEYALERLLIGEPAP